MVKQGRYGSDRQGSVRHDAEGFGRARQVWLGWAGRDQARQARSVMAERGAVWTGLAGKAWLGRPRCSKARQVWQGAARSGKARQVWTGGAWTGEAGCGSARQARQFI